MFSQPQTITLTLGTLDLTNTTAPIDIDWTGSNALTISGNGAFGTFAISPGVTANFTGLTMIDGSAATSGGAISNAGDLTVTDSALMDNAALSGSGAGIINTGALTVINSSFSDNDAAYYGGAIYNNGGNLSVSSSTFEGNATLYGLGGAMDNQGGTLTVTSSTFLDNSSFEGGAIFSRAGMASVTNSTIMGNSAYQGGGLFNDGTGTTTGTFTVTDSTIAGNSAFQGGGVSNNFGGTMTIVDSTLANNTATQYGGAIDEVGTLTLISDTIAYNVVVAGGIAGGIDAYAGTTALYDTIVVLNTVGTGSSVPASDIVGPVSTASAYNIIGTGGLTNGVNNNLVGVTKPGLAAGLANNGGPTETIALLAGSPAIGAGSATITGVVVPLTDQRGEPLDLLPDIGAYQTSSIIVMPALRTASATPAVATSPTANAPVAATTTPSIVSSTNPFKGRKLSARPAPQRGRHDSHERPPRGRRVPREDPSCGTRRLGRPENPDRPRRQASPIREPISGGSWCRSRISWDDRICDSRFPDPGESGIANRRLHSRGTHGSDPPFAACPSTASSTPSSCEATSRLSGAPGEMSLDSIVYMKIFIGFRPSDSPSWSASTSPSPCVLQGRTAASSGQGQTNDRIVPGWPAGAAASIRMPVSCPSRHSRRSIPPRTLCAEMPGTGHDRSRSMATQPSLVVTMRAAQSHDRRSCRATTFNFKEWVAQLMQGS